MEQEYSKLNLINTANIKDDDAKFNDTVEEFPLVEAMKSSESDQTLSISQSSSISDLGHGSSNNNDNADISIQSKNTPESPSSPSSAGLRRRLVSQHSWKDTSRPDSFKNNAHGLVDFEHHDSSISPREKYKISLNLKDNDKSNENLNSSTVHVSSDSVNQRLNEETNESSEITSANDDERINYESDAVDSPNSGPNFLFTFAGLVIKTIGFQMKLLVTFITFPIWFMDSVYMFVIDPFGIMRRGKNYVYSGVKWIVYLWIKKHESTWKLCLRMGWGLLWSTYVGVVLVGLLVFAFVLSGIMMKCIVEEPIQMKEQLNFDYTRDSPMAFVPIVSCPESSCLECNEKIKLKSTAESRVIPSDQKLQATVSITLPESDYNRNLGIFQVRVDFLTSNGKPLESIRQPCMLQFKSQPIRLLLTFLKLAPLVTGYSSESQNIDIKFKEHTERNIPTSCLRVVLEQRAEFGKGGGVPEIYSASLKIESQLPLLKRILWSWKIMIYLWISIMVFIMELLFALLFCTPILLWSRRV